MTTWVQLLVLAASLWAHSTSLSLRFFPNYKNWHVIISTSYWGDQKQPCIHITHGKLSWLSHPQVSTTEVGNVSEGSVTYVHMDPLFNTHTPASDIKQEIRKDLKWETKTVDNVVLICGYEICQGFYVLTCRVLKVDVFSEKGRIH